VPLDVEAINAALDDLEVFGPDVRTVITPQHRPLGFLKP